MPTGNSFSSVDGRTVIAALERAGWQSRNASSDHVVMSKPGHQQIVIRPTAITHDAVRAAERVLNYKFTKGRGVQVRQASKVLEEELVALGGGGARFEKEKPGMTSKLEIRHPEDQAVIDSYRPENRVNEFDHGSSKPSEQVLPPVSFPNESDQAALVRLAKRRLERLDVEFQQVQIKYQQLQEQHTATVLFLESLGVETERAGAPAVQAEPPKRTVLPYAGPKTRRPQISSAVKDKIRMAYADAGSPSGYGWVKKVQAKLVAFGVKDVPDHVIGTKSWAR